MPVESRTRRPLVLEPFRAVRYSESDERTLGLVTSPPYDVIGDPAAVESLRSTHPHNVVRLILPRADEDVAGTLRQWLQHRVLLQDQVPALYLYEYSNGGATVRGLVGNLALRDYSESVILPHEDVMPGPVAGRAALMRATHANLEPILLVYDGNGGASDVADDAVHDRPLMRAFTEDGSVHSVWRITDPQQLTVVADDLAPRKALIADGHHRYAAYRLCRSTEPGPQWDYGLAMLVDQRRHPLRLGAIHRVVAGLRLEDILDRPAGGQWREAGPDTGKAMTALHESEAPAAVLATDGARGLLWEGGGAAIDTAALHEVLLPAWQVPEDQVEYVHDREVAVARARAQRGLALLVRPPSVAAVAEASQRGVMMPRKSTSFGPKPRMGLLMRLLDG